MDRIPLNLMLIDDDPVDAEIFSRFTEEISGLRITLASFTDQDAALDHLRTGAAFDMIFVDYILGGTNGIEMIRRIREIGRTEPIIMLTGQGSELVAVKAMKAGAADYLVKSDLSTEDIARALMHVMEKEALRRKIEEQQRELERLARMDDLTGIFNRRWFMQLLIEEVARCIVKRSPVALLMLDIDHFKSVNDTYGHITGDTALQRFAKIVVDTLGDRGVAGRFGGEEFCAFLPGLALHKAAAVAEEIRAAVEAADFRDENGSRFPLTCSIGVGVQIDGARGLRDVIHDADEALYQAKATGRNRVCP